jgi:hypothetical protein
MSGRSAMRIVTTRGDKLVMVIALAGGSIGLTFFARHVARVNQAIESDQHFGSAKVISESAVRLWLPGRLVELATRRTTQPPIRTHEELRRVLEVEQQRDVWYALTMRECRDDGATSDLTTIRWPYDDPRNFVEYPEVLAVAAGNRSSDSTVDFSLVSVCVVPDHSCDRTPREVIAEVLGTDLK